MTYLIASDVQAWLNETAVVVTEVEPTLEQNAADYVFGRCTQRYTTTTWLNAATTPRQVLDIVSMLYAAWIYQRYYSESATIDSTNYGWRMEGRVNNLLDMIATGELVLVDTIGTSTIITTSGSPSFYPTDAQETDLCGNEIKFTMGAQF